MAEAQTENMVIDGFTPEWYAGTEANDGGSFTRHPIGDYRKRVKTVAVEAAKSADKPHNMLVVELETIGVASGGEGDASAVGMVQKVYYGTPQSPKFMQQRAKAFLQSLGVNGPFAPKVLIGRELDVTVVWEKSSPVINAATGEEKIYVNDRVCFERKMGTAKSAKANAKALSAVAMKYLDEEAPVGEEGAPAGDAPAWEEPKTAAGTNGAATNGAAAHAAPKANGAVANAAPADGWIPEEKVQKQVHQYRALIALGKPNAAEARKSLADRKINPDGPILAEHLPEPMKAEYETWKAAQGGAETGEGGEGGDGLPPLGDLPGLDGGAAPAGGESEKKKTGTRAKKDK